MAQLTLDNLSTLPFVAKELLKAFGDKKVIAFHGEMGAGKTTLIKELCHVLGVREVVSSPTFSIVNEYLSESGQKIYHFDFYRLNNLNEAYDMGYEEYFFSDAYCFIEWPEKVASLLPENVLNVYISVHSGQREIRLDQ